MTEADISIQYGVPKEVVRDGGIDALITEHAPLAQFLADWEAMRESLSQPERMKHTRFPALHEGARGFILDAMQSEMIGLGDDQYMQVKVVPGAYDNENPFNFQGEPFSLTAPLFIRPRPVTIALNDIIVHETEKEEPVHPATLKQYMALTKVDLKHHDTVDIYSAVALVPICSSPKGGKQYRTQMMVYATSDEAQWYKPIMQGKAFGGPIFYAGHSDKRIDMIQGDDEGRYWKINPIDVFGGVAQQVFGNLTGRLIIVSVPLVEDAFPSPLDDVPHTIALEDRMGSFQGITSTTISAGGKTGGRYQRGTVEVDPSRRIKAFSILTMGVRPEYVNKIAVEDVFPYLTTTGN